MPKHEFGIMQKGPVTNKRYDSYEPEKYNCIAIDDDYIEAVSEKLLNVDCYWHTLKRPEKGLAYYGVTIIPPNSMDALIEMLLRQDVSECIPLIDLAKKAKEDEKYIIHFGI